MIDLDDIGSVEKVMNVLKRSHPSIFSRFDFSSEDMKTKVLKGIFSNKKKIYKRDLNLLSSLLKTSNPFNTIYSYVEYLELMENSEDFGIPVYLDIYNYDNLRKVEYMEVEIEEKYITGDQDIELCCVVVPIYREMNRTDIFLDMENIFYESNKKSEPSDKATTYWNLLCDLFEPVLDSTITDNDKRNLIKVDSSIEESFRLVVGRYNTTKYGRILYIGSNIFIETIKDGQLYINSYKIDLDNQEYKQKLVYFIKDCSELFDSGNIIDNTEYEKQKLNSILKYLQGG